MASTTAPFRSPPCRAWDTGTGMKTRKMDYRSLGDRAKCSLNDSDRDEQAVAPGHKQGQNRSPVEVFQVAEWDLCRCLLSPKTGSFIPPEGVFWEQNISNGALSVCWKNGTYSCIDGVTTNGCIEMWVTEKCAANISVKIIHILHTVSEHTLT